MVNYHLLGIDKEAFIRLMKENGVTAPQASRYANGRKVKGQSKRMPENVKGNARELIFKLAREKQVDAALLFEYDIQKSRVRILKACNSGKAIKAEDKPQSAYLVEHGYITEKGNLTAKGIDYLDELLPKHDHKEAAAIHYGQFEPVCSMRVGVQLTTDWSAVTCKVCLKKK